ncbi:N-acetylmuramoyl-L-alanine amidase, partial [Alkalibacillus silvisoli]|uniref:N-acetylmuramoyl-L-alanine amidase n=1 Tax=Alkalibacillus silvisoli TaxID=392823 RepID=UPI0031DA0E8C
VVRDFQEAYGLPVSGIMDEVSLSELNYQVNTNVVKIFFDPGHGGNDPGGQGYGLKEKDVALDIALKTANILTQNYIGIDIEFSRKTDETIELSNRATMANDWGADYFMSFHNNAFDGTAHGFETFIYNGNVSGETKERQQDIHTYIKNRIDVNDRGMKEANFNVLRNTEMPALLLEYLFIDNYEENQLLRSESYLNHLAQVTAEAVAQSFDLNRR